MQERDAVADEPPMTLSIHGVAENLQVSVNAVRKMMAKGDFPVPDLYVLSLARWKRATLTTWIDERAAQGAADAS